MGNRHGPEPDHRLEAYFATLRSSALRDAIRRSVANWQLYAVTGSAMAMATGASASLIGAGVPENPPEPIASLLAARQNFASFRTMPSIKATRVAMARLDGASVPVNASPVTPAQAPLISPNGVVPIYGTASSIEPGEWITIYGTNLAGATTMWNGDFPTSLGGASVQINGKAAYLMFVSPGQINVQAPDDTATGTVSVVVTTAAGSATSTVTLSQFAPSFSLVASLKAGYVAGIILRSNGSGAYGKGTYDILGPAGSAFGYPTVAAQPGDIVELFGVGFGPTTPVVPAGTAFSGAAPINNEITLYINNIRVVPSFVGLSSAGLYQINLTVPAGLGQGEVPVQAIIGGMQTQANVLFSLQGPTTATSAPVGGGSVGSSPPPPFSFSPGPPDSGGGSGGGGGSSDAAHRKKPYGPRLKFPPK